MPEDGVAAPRPQLPGTIAGETTTPLILINITGRRFHKITKKGELA
jgi:hypothetical protein